MSNEDLGITSEEALRGAEELGRQVTAMAGEAWGPSEDELQMQAMQDELDDMKGRPRREREPIIEHRDGIAWADERVHLRGWRGRWPFHTWHQAQTRGIGSSVIGIERCRCGAIRQFPGDYWIRL